MQLPPPRVSTSPPCFKTEAPSKQSQRSHLSLPSSPPPPPPPPKLPPHLGFPNSSSGREKMGRKKKVMQPKEEIAEDFCFVCKDGGLLQICDYREIGRKIVEAEMDLSLAKSQMYSALPLHAETLFPDSNS